MCQNNQSTNNYRKPRSDKGQVRGPRAINSKTRSDKGQPREIINKSSAYYLRLYKAALNGAALLNDRNEVVGDGLTIDVNGIFDFKVTKKWKTITVQSGTRVFHTQHGYVSRDVQGCTYRSKVKLKRPYEKFRWDWLHSSALENTDVDKFCQKYFIKPEEFLNWTFREWANAYLHCKDLITEDHNYRISYFDEDNGFVIDYPESILLSAFEEL